MSGLISGAGQVASLPGDHGRRQAATTPAPAGQRSALLVLAFTFFNSTRVFSYLPTLWAIYASGDSSQHSLWTWLSWLGANLTMVAWLHDRRTGGFSGPALVNLANAAMCFAMVLLICWCRW